MTGVKDSTLQALRLRYNAALAAHQGCIRALAEAGRSGALPSSRALQAEAKARHELERARAALLTAMTESITGHAAEPEPDRSPQQRSREPERDA
jgi:hypothetical protein